MINSRDCLSLLRFAGCGIIAVSVLAGCGSSDEKAAEKAAPSTAESTTATAVGGQPDLEFFTERYLAPEKRLQRRQERIESVLAGR